jgi:ribosomal protein S18 acetylase RimI-like enzyme
MDIREDAWLSTVFGYPVFAVEPAAAGELERHVAGLERAFYSARVPVEHPGDMRALEAAGLRVVDVGVTLVRNGADPVAHTALDVGLLRAGDPEAVLEIAGTCFRYSRFHLDPLVPPATADKVKREWVASYVTGARGLELLVARDGGTPVGFLAVLADGDARVIDLVGVSVDRQARGVGTALVAAFVERHGPQARELRVGTQIANVPSLRLYARFGFGVTRSEYVLHGHRGGAA